MKNIIILTLVSILFSPQFITAQNWTFQAEKSQLKWAGKAAFSTYTLEGRIDLKSAEIQTSEDNIQVGTFIFDMKSMNGEIKDLIKHLKSKDFFEVKKYKTATFELKEMSINDKGESIAKGELTIKGKTKPIEFVINSRNVDNQLTIKGKAIVNRTEYGITFNSPSFFEKLKDQAIADDFELDFELVFVKK